MSRFFVTYSQISLVLLISLMTAACGSNLQSQQTKIEPKANETGGTSPSGRPYTTFSNPEDVKSIVKPTATPKTESTVAASSGFAEEFKNFDSIRVLPLTTTQLKVTMESKTRSLSLDGVFESDLTSRLSVDNDFDLVVKCKDSACETSELVLVKRGQTASNETALASALIVRETRFVDIKQNGSTSASHEISNLVALANSGNLKFFVESTQIFPGKSSVSLEYRDNKGQLALGLFSELVATQGSCLPAKVTGTLKDIGQFCLAGNNKTGRVIFRLSSGQNTPVWFELRPRGAQGSSITETALHLNSAHSGSTAKATPNSVSKTFISAARPNTAIKPVTAPITAKPSPPVTSTKPATPTAPHPRLSTNPLLPSNEIHPLVQQILADKDRPEILEQIEYWKTEGKTLLKSFMGSYTEAVRSLKTVKGTNFKTMMSVLNKSGLPLALSFVTLIESKFSPTALNASSGAYGYWQFIPCTAKEYDLKGWWNLRDPKCRTAPVKQTPDLLKLAKVDERTLIGPSTRAASQYFKALLKYHAWGDDIRFALASYNYGEGNMRKRYNKAIAITEAEGEQEDAADLTLDEASDFSTNFWTLYDYDMIPNPKRPGQPIAQSRLNNETKNYVTKIMAAIILATDMKAFDYTANLESMRLY